MNWINLCQAFFFNNEKKTKIVFTLNGSHNHSGLSFVSSLVPIAYLNWYDSIIIHLPIICGIIQNTEWCMYTFDVNITNYWLEIDQLYGAIAKGPWPNY